MTLSRLSGLLAAAAGSIVAQGNYFTAAAPITELNQLGSDSFSPTLSEDELYMVFASNRPGGFGDFDLYETSRPSVDATWAPPQDLVPLNSSGADYEPNLSYDGLELYFISTRAGSIGLSDVYVSQRPSTAAPWGPPINLGPPVNGPGLANDDPHLTQDGLTMFFSQGGDIQTTTRPAIGAPWTPPVPFAPANGPAADHSPIPEGPGDIVWFASNRSGGPAGSSDFYFVYRDPSTLTYSAPQPVADLSSAGWDSNGSRGGHTGRMYTSRYPGGTANYQLWRFCPRATIVWVSRCIVYIDIPHVQLFPPRITWRRVWLVSIQVPTIQIVWYRWFPWPSGGFSALVASFGLSNPPIPANTLLPGAEGDLFLGSTSLTLSLLVIPPNSPPGLEQRQLAIPNAPGLVGLNIHLQNAGLELGNNHLTLSEPGTVRLTL